MLKNASSLAIVGLDTAENGPSKVRQVTNRIDAIIGRGARVHGARAGDLLQRGDDDLLHRREHARLRP